MKLTTLTIAALLGTTSLVMAHENGGKRHIHLDRILAPHDHSEKGDDGGRAHDHSEKDDDADRDHDHSEKDDFGGPRKK